MQYQREMKQLVSMNLMLIVLSLWSMVKCDEERGLQYTWSASYPSCSATPTECDGCNHAVPSFPVVYVNCSSRNLTKIPTFLSVKRTIITAMNLHSNAITNITDNDFDHLNIDELDLSDNQLYFIDDNAFTPLRKTLRILHLENTNISLQKPLVFLKNLTNLEHLNLDRNGIWPLELNGDIFLHQEFPSLKKLTLRGCEIFHLANHSLDYLHTLQELDLSYNHLTVVPEALLALDNLRTLILYGNYITYLPDGCFRRLINLRHIDLKLNKLFGIRSMAPGAFFGLENSLETLEFHNNHLVGIPSFALQRLRKLVFLDVSYNSIIFLGNDSFIGEYQLKTLILNGNTILFHEHMFHNLEDTLEILKMRHMGFEQLPVHILRELKQLKWLDASFNKITSLRAMGLSDLHIRRLTLLHVGLSEVSPQAFSHFKQPLTLELGFNNITDLSFVPMIEDCKLESLDVTGNPIQCTCAVEKILNGELVKAIKGMCSSNNTKRFDINSAFVLNNLVKLCGKSNHVQCSDGNCMTMTARSLAMKLTTMIFIVSLCITY